MTWHLIGWSDELLLVLGSSHSSFQVLQASLLHFTVSQLWVLCSSSHNSVLGPVGPCHIASAHCIENAVSNSSSVVEYVSVIIGTCLLSCYLAVNVSSGSTIPVLRCHVAILIWESTLTFSSSWSLLLCIGSSFLYLAIVYNFRLPFFRFSAFIVL
jgi:hypothetical protein